MALSLNTTVNDIQFENPFLLASGPPGTNAKVIAKSYDLGWGGVVCKTISLDSSKVINTAPRYAKLKAREDDKVIVGFENIELISDRPFEAWLDEFRQLKWNYPRKILIASIMEEYRREAWHEIVRRVQDTGVDGFELNLSCPHGLPERKMGMAMGEDPHIVEEVVGWVKEVSKIPVWAKMTPNVGNPAVPALAAVQFFLLGAHTVQVCTGAMLQGYEIVAKMKEELVRVMTDHHFERVRDMVGKSLPYFSTHADLVQRQKAAKAAKVGNAKDAETWKGEIKKEADALVSN